MAIVVSHIADDFETLRRQALRQAPLADLIELRLDRIGHPGEERLRSFFAECPKPVIVACHDDASPRGWDGSLDERLDLLSDAARCGARFVDIDWRLSLDLGEVEAPAHRIVSRHFENAVPTNLDDLLEEQQAVLCEGDVTKLVAHATKCEDGLRLLRWLRTTKGIVSFATGAAGSFTRLLAPIFGSPFTYCAPAAMPGEPEPEATAAGQLRVNDLLGLLPPGGISQETAIFGVVGNPVGASYSPIVHGMALKAAKLDAVYVRFEPDEFDAFLALADDENFRGFSVTAPFKEHAFRAAHQRETAAAATGAANTLVRDQGQWRAANSDVAAVRATLEQAFRVHAERGLSPASLAGARVLVLGAGGAARAAIHAAQTGNAVVSIAARRPERAQALAQEFGVSAVAWEAVGATPYDALVHATPAGSAAQPDALAIGPEALRRGTVVLDAVYHPIRTPLLIAAHERGLTAVPGGEWFVRQAAEQFRWWTQGDADELLLRKSFEHAHETLRR
ncbi:MAG: type I 3-dehydroquinate dehydratase [Planctomycetota bacterium]